MAINSRNPVSGAYGRSRGLSTSKFRAHTGARARCLRGVTEHPINVAVRLHGLERFWSVGELVQTIIHLPNKYDCRLVSEEKAWNPVEATFLQLGQDFRAIGGCALLSVKTS